MMLVHMLISSYVQHNRGIMISNKIVIEITKNEHRFTLLMDPVSTWGELYDVLSEMKSHVVDKMKEYETKSKEEDKEP